GISPAGKTSEINSLFKKFDLSSAIDQRVGQYSRGMKQKLALISCLVSDASLLFLDEPTLGLDFVASRTLIRQIKEINQQLHKTIILTSHQADVLEKLVDDVLLIDNQKVRFFGPYEE
ncbi:AAA family ATPase, partial [Enterococcus faecium]|uniref:AAA family ATPase n=1 Tax=Enterococcus faecium TaxID=1352 RepID=UPI0034E98A18